MKFKGAIIYYSNNLTEELTSGAARFVNELIRTETLGDVINFDDVTIFTKHIVKIDWKI